MALFKRLQEEESDSGNTAMVYVYFWLAGAFVLLRAGLGARDLMQNRPGVSITRTILAFATGLLYIIGAWLIGRFNRNGIIFVAIGLLLGLYEWIGHTPGTNDIIFAVVTVMALIYAWRDLTSTAPPA